MAAHNLRIFWG